MPRLRLRPMMARTMRLGAVGRRDVADERLVDLDLVEREAAQIAQRRIAGAEIVHRDADAEVAQRVQGRERRAAVGEQHRFGDLEFEPLRRASRTAASALRHALHQPRRP